MLHDQLLTLFQKQPDLKPRDIIVMVADINRYSPAIQAVFGMRHQHDLFPILFLTALRTKKTPLSMLIYSYCNYLPAVVLRPSC